MDEVEKERMDMEREKQQQIEARRKASANFDAFDVDFGPSSSRRETFDVPSSKQLNLTRNVNDAKQNNKENINRGLFPLSDISEISISDDAVKVSRWKPHFYSSAEKHLKVLLFNVTEFVNFLPSFKFLRIIRSFFI